MKLITNWDKVLIDNWTEATLQLTKHFVHKYFGKDAGYWWVANEVGVSVLYVNDYWFDLERVVQAIDYNATFEQLTDYYDFEYEHSQSKYSDKPTPINFRNWIKGARPKDLVNKDVDCENTTLERLEDSNAGLEADLQGLVRAVFGAKDLDQLKEATKLNYPVEWDYYMGFGKDKTPDKPEEKKQTFLHYMSNVIVNYRELDTEDLVKCLSDYLDRYK